MDLRIVMSILGTPRYLSLVYFFIAPLPSLLVATNGAACAVMFQRCVGAGGVPNPAKDELDHEQWAISKASLGRYPSRVLSLLASLRRFSLIVRYPDRMGYCIINFLHLCDSDLFHSAKKYHSAKKKDQVSSFTFNSMFAADRIRFFIIS